MMKSLQHRMATILLVFVIVISCFIAPSTNSPVAKADLFLLRPPFNNLPNGSTFQITSYFDHYSPNYMADPDKFNITVYTGETGSSIGKDTYYDEPYSYYGHPGYDFSTPAGTEIVAAAAGTAYVYMEDNPNYGNYVCIKHPSGLYTLYAHLSQIDVDPGDVEMGQRIGLSGATGTTRAHLHFAVQRSTCARADAGRLEYNATDPFGWKGTNPDPLSTFSIDGLPGLAASCLWRSAREDPISCADTVYEDGAQGHSLVGAWNFDRFGHGFHRYTRYNTSGNELSQWKFDVPYTQPAEVYAWIPPVTTEHATYEILTANGWKYVTINQKINTDRWVLLGSFIFKPDPINNKVILRANTGTGDLVNTKTVGVDAIKFRTYQNNVPIAHKSYCLPSSQEKIVNGDFSLGNINEWEWDRDPPTPDLDIVLAYGTNEHGARLGMANTEDFIMQTVCIPPGTSSAILTYRIYVISDEAAAEPTAYDSMVVTVKDQNNIELRNLASFYNTTNENVWIYKTHDLKDFAGKMVKISFGAWNDPINRTVFWIDDVSFITN